MVKITVNKLAELTGKNRRTIKKRISDLDPIAKEGNANLYDSEKALAAIYFGDYESQISTDPEKVPEGSCEKVASARFKTAKAEKMEMELDQLKGKLIETDQVCEIVEKQYSIVRSSLFAVPTRISKQLSVIDEPEEIHEKLVEAINEALKELTGVTIESLEDDE